MSSLLVLSGCGDTMRNKVERVSIRINRHDSQGRPIKSGFIDEEKPLMAHVKYELEDGTFNREKMDVNGQDVSPPPLPQETKKP